jgi:ribonuclease R
VPLRDLDDDMYYFDEENYCIVGRRTQNKYQLGDPIRIVIARANLEKKQLDFALAGTDLSLRSERDLSRSFNTPPKSKFAKEYGGKSKKSKSGVKSKPSKGKRPSKSKKR